ncbi:unnamed protein product [Brassica oleracea var. botrytis]
MQRRVNSHVYYAPGMLLIKGSTHRQNYYTYRESLFGDALNGKRRRLRDGGGGQGGGATEEKWRIGEINGGDEERDGSIGGGRWWRKRLRRDSARSCRS